MAIVILLLAGVAAALEVALMRHMMRSGRRTVDAPATAPAHRGLHDVVEETAAEIALLLDLQACWFEPFPFDRLLPRIEQGRIVLPTPEPGVEPCSGAGIELPVRVNGLTLGRFVLVPPKPSAGALFAPTARDRAVTLAARAGAPLAAAWLSGEAVGGTAHTDHPREVSS